MTCVAVLANASTATERMFVPSAVEMIGTIQMTTIQRTITMAEPRQKPGRSKQDVGTPEDFLQAVKDTLGIDAFYCDLAATDENRKAGLYLSPEIDALSVPWTFRDGWCWLNPEFSNIAPWVQKSYESAAHDGVHIAVLVPAAVGSNWWRDWVHDKADVRFLNGRITFDGHTQPYPKDCALLLYSPPSIACRGSYDVWTWKPSRSAQVTGDPLGGDAKILSPHASNAGHNA